MNVARPISANNKKRNLECYNIFIDESGSADPKSHENSPYFTLCGVLITDKNRDLLQLRLNELKLNYFNTKQFILHSSELRYQLRKHKKELPRFSRDLRTVIKNCDFSLIYVVVNKAKAYQKGWDSVHVYKQSYKILLSNLLKFLVAKKLKGQIFAEASNANQDIHLYQAFFHLIRRGIERLSITNSQARQRLTSLCFVTKPNNDCEEQLADFFGIFGRLKMEIGQKSRKVESLDEFEKAIYALAEKRLFRVPEAQKPRKILLYNEINSFKIIP